MLADSSSWVIFASCSVNLALPLSVRAHTAAKETGSPALSEMEMVDGTMYHFTEANWLRATHAFLFSSFLWRANALIANHVIYSNYFHIYEDLGHFIKAVFNCRLPPCLLKYFGEACWASGKYLDGVQGLSHPSTPKARAVSTFRHRKNLGSSTTPRKRVSLQFLGYFCL